MKRNFKRTLSLILAVLMIVTVVPFSGMAAVCTHPNAVVVKSNTEIKHTVICPDCTLNETSDCASSNTEAATCQNPHYCDVCNRELSSTHSFTLEVEAPQTLVEDVNCDEFKEYYKTCACGKISETEKFTSKKTKGTKHDFTAESDEYIAKKVCGENLFYYFACSRCGVSAEGFDVNPNTYADEDITVEHNFKEPDEPVEGTLKSHPTCTSPAVFYMTCEICSASAKGIDETKTYTYGNKIDHEFITFNDVDLKDIDTSKYLINPATCNDQAFYSKFCKNCGAPEVEGLWDDDFDADDKEHSIQSDKYDDKGNKISNGNAFYYGEPLNHGRIKVTKEAKAATCTADGNTEELTCEYCNTVLVASEKLPKLGHNPDSTLIQEYKAPTCVQNGQLGKVKCTREGCGTILEVNGKGEWETTKDNFDSFNVTKRGHIDEDENLVCDREECLSSLEPSDVCPCLCHGTGFMYFIGWILKWFWSLTGTNPYCQCSIPHYAVD